MIYLWYIFKCLLNVSVEKEVIMTVLLFLAIFVVLLYVMYRLQKNHVSYPKRTFAGLGLGIVFGAAIQFFLGAESQTTATLIEWIDVVGTGYVRFLQLLVVPLIFVSLVRAFTEVQGSTNLGKISVNVLSVLIITVMIASAIGIGSVLLFNLDGAEFTRGAAEMERIASLQESQAQVADLTIPQQLINFIPANIFEDLAGSRPTSIIAVVIFSALIGVAYLGVARKQPEHGKMFESMIDALHAIVMRIVTLVLRMAPFGILALMTKMVATSSVDALLNMGTFLVASYAAFLVMFLIHALILTGFKLNPITYFKNAWEVLSFAFTSRSSAGALPMNIQTQQEAMGVDSTTANFSATFGLSIGQNGCAGIYPSMLVAVVAPAVGMDLSNPMTWLTIIATVAISSFGVAGVGGGATFASLIVFGTLGLPVEIIGLMISIEPVIDMGRTALNVNDSILAGVIASKRQDTLDQDVYDSEDHRLTTENAM